MQRLLAEQIFIFTKDLTRESTADDIAGAHFFQALVNAFVNRRFAVIENGWFGLVPRMAEPGDIVAMMVNSLYPMLLRSKANGGFSLVGNCYIDQMMTAEARDLIFDEKSNLQLCPFRIS